MSKRLPVVWDADPHTIAKIEILKAYLNAWFRILGMSRLGEKILYVDGFAGPGRYRNYDEGSPLAAIRAAGETIQNLGEKFVAAELHRAFIESHAERFKVLSETVEPFIGKPRIGITHKHCEFVRGIEEIRKELPEPFRGDGPLFVFAEISYRDCAAERHSARLKTKAPRSTITKARQFRFSVRRRH
jgi:three-Cys-motif partner protein